MAVTRFVASRSRTMYAIWPDEPAQLAMARFFAGGTRWDMHDHSTWKPGYALVISPIHWFTDDPATVFRSAMVINAVLGGVAAVLLVLLTRRLTSLSPWGSAVAAAVAMSVPASLFATDFVWSESLLVTLFLATLLVLVRFDELPGLARGVAVAAATTALFSTHSRMLPLLPVAVGVVAVAALHRRTTRRSATVSVLLTTAGAGVVQWSSSTIVERLWREPADTNTVGAVAERVTDVGPLIVAAAGQWWYLMVSSLGVVGFGVWGIARRIRAGSAQQRRAATIVATSIVGCVALSVVFMSARVRPDRIVYGRYNDAVITPLFVMGLAVLVGSIGARRIAIAGGVIGTSLLAAGAVLVAFRAEPLADGNGIEPMILGLQPFVSGRPSIAVVPVTVAALFIGIGVVAAVMLGRGRGRRMVPGALVIAALLVLGGLETADAIERGWTDTNDIAPIQALTEGPLAEGDPVDFYVRAGTDNTKALMAYQFVLSRSPFTVIESLADGNARFVMAPSDSVWPPDQPARRLWRDPTRSISLWERQEPDG